MTRTDVVDERILTSWVQDFARFPSPQTALFEREPQVQSFLAGPVVDVLNQYDLPWRRDSMGSVIVEFGPSDGTPSLMIMAYAMTHPAGRMNDPYCGTLKDGGRRIRGRGVSEQKGALAAAIAAAAAARNLKLKGRFVLAISAAGETGRHDAAELILQELGYTPSAVVIAIGTTGRLALANKGRIDVEVKVTGRASHSSTPAAGVDAIEGARRVMDRVLAIDVGTRSHPGLGMATLAATSIRSWPEATHTIQDEVRIVFDRRLLPGEDDDVAYRQISAAADIGEPWQVETVRGPRMFPAEIAETGMLAGAIRKGCAAQGLPAPETFHSSGALDAGMFCALGAEAAMFGPGDMSLWHTNEESIGIDDLVTGAKAYAGMVKAYLCQPDRGA